MICPTEKMEKGGDAGEVFIAARKITGNGKIIADGGDGSIGGKGGKVTLISDNNQFTGEISAKGGKSISSVEHITASIEKSVKRGKESWAFLWTVFGLALAICLFVVSVLSISSGEKIAVGLLAVILLAYVCLWHGWSQNKLIGLKVWLENSWKKL